MTLGQFDSDTGALERRIKSHDQFGSVDITPWILESLAPSAGQRALDLGCGTGKQSLPLAEIVGPEGAVVSVDVSADALKIVMEKAREKGVDGRIRVANSGLDDLAEVVGDERFQRVVGCYSLYYAQDPAQMFKTIHAALDPGGILFFCGPSHLNNDELKQFHFALRGEAVPDTTAGARFMEGEGRALVQGLFREVEILSFENPLRFDSAEALHSYWSSYNLYDADRDDEFKASAARYFEVHDHFETVKRAVGVRATT